MYCADFELLDTFLKSFGHISILENVQNPTYKTVLTTLHIAY